AGMRLHAVRVHPPGQRPAREDQLAWKIAAMAVDGAPLDPDAAEMARNRIIDNMAVAVAALNRAPGVAAREQAMCFPAVGGAAGLGLPATQRFDPCWAAYANATAVRELDFHDSFF